MNSRVLLICYGNPGRQDDGLGPALAERLENLNIAGVEIDSDYQLTVEHALDISQVDIVIFVDATLEDSEPFYFRPLFFDAVDANLSFSTHSISPQAVLKLSDKLFQSKAKAYVLGIRGYAFSEIAEGLTPQAIDNLKLAEVFITPYLQSGDFFAACQASSGMNDLDSVDGTHA